MTLFTFCACLLASALLNMLGGTLITFGYTHNSDLPDRIGSLLCIASFVVLAALAVALHRVR